MKFISKFLILNMTGLGLLFYAWVNEWVAKVWEHDTSHISVVIFALFVYGLVTSTIRAWKLSNEIDLLSNGNDSRRLVAYLEALRVNKAATRALEIRMFSRITHLRAIANMLVILGLIGTVYGFILIAGGITADAASDVTQVGNLVGILLNGMGVAFYTTLVGAIFSIWCGINVQMLHSATALVLALLMTSDESNQN